jgi:hypothetical protein
MPHLVTTSTMRRANADVPRVEMRDMSTYTDGTLTVKGYWWPRGTARAGSWALIDQATGNVQGAVPAGEFSRRFRPVDVFTDVPGSPPTWGRLPRLTVPRWWI